MWVKLDDKFANHPKVVGLTGGAFRLHVAGLCYCGRYLTDGRIPPDVPKLLVPSYRPSHLAELTKAGLWHKEMDGAHWIHDFLEYNPSAHDSDLGAEARTDRAVTANHVRWHVRRGIADPDCDLCRDPPKDP